MRNFNIAIFGGAALVGAVLLASSSEAQTKNTGTSRLRLVRAQCTTGPCNPAYSMISGSVQIKKVKRPRLSTSEPIGNVNLKGVVALSGGTVTAVLPNEFAAAVSGTRYYGTDPTSDCPTEGSIETGVFATATVDCFDAQGSSRCNGDILMTPPESALCDDVDVSIEDIQVEVTPTAPAGVNTRLFARVGRTVVGDGNPSSVTGNSEGGRLRLTRAMCGGVPCNTHDFKDGLAVLKRVKYSRLESNVKFGRVKIKGLTSPVPASVVAQVSANSTYGIEFKTADCVGLPGTTSSGVIASATMPCQSNGKCKGNLELPATVDPDCSDVDWVMEDVRVRVYDATMVGIPAGLIAVDGATVLAD